MVKHTGMSITGIGIGLVLGNLLFAMFFGELPALVTAAERSFFQVIALAVVYVVGKEGRKND